ncbi:MAG: BPL-N domain-containing protein [Thermodesulfovibrionales bacterium]
MRPTASTGTFSEKAALLWDESFLWGVMACKALQAARLPFDLIRSEDIRAGRLGEYRLLFVPGGWASNKIKALGDAGVAAVRDFVQRGGRYLGFCGGAGLATQDGIGLLPVRRKPTRERVPSFSGRIRLSLSEHPIWLNSSEPVFHAWWPSQFIAEDPGLRVLASYGEALPDAFSSDVNVGDTEQYGSWAELEALYRINLDPRRLRNDPAVVEGTFGEGRVILSLIHFDTPDDERGAAVLRSLWEYLLGAPVCRGKEESAQGDPAQDCIGQREVTAQDPQADALLTLVRDLEASVDGLISLGMRNFLWFRRNALLFQWRRGVRGLEYCTLHMMTKEIAEIVRRGRHGWDSGGIARCTDRAAAVKEVLLPFVGKAQRLLVLERHALQSGHITYEKCDDPLIREMRGELFSTSKSHGGMFKELIDTIDALLFSLLHS